MNTKFDATTVGGMELAIGYAFTLGTIDAINQDDQRSGQALRVKITSKWYGDTGRFLRSAYIAGYKTQTRERLN